jgi:DNA (cytosine-5)-methyltransferase 1
VANDFSLGELFCGPGGIALGAQAAAVEGSDIRIRHQWATDYDADTCKTYRNNICPHNPQSVIEADIRDLELPRLRDLGSIDGLAFGFPCNDFSMVGERLGLKGKYGPLYTYGVDALNEFRPRWFVAENVGGLRQANEAKAFTKILHDLEDTGYTLTPHLYKFEEYGVPQTRHRIIIVGIRNDESLKFKVPAPADAPVKTASEAISGIPSWATNHEHTRQHPRVVGRLKLIDPGENAFNAKRLNRPENKQFQLNVKGAHLSQIYKRLHPDKPAYTVTGSGGGGTHMYHWSEPRALTNRERARLQTFPDTFRFEGSRESVRKQIGMAVPPDGVETIFRAIIRTFEGMDYAHVDPNIEVPSRTDLVNPELSLEGLVRKEN